MSQRTPTHPGAILREDVLPSLAGMSVSAGNIDVDLDAALLPDDE